MRLVLALVLGLALAACNPFAPPSTSTDTPAVATVRAVYAAYQNPTPTPTGDSADWSGFRSKQLAALFDALPAKQLASDEPILDFDPIVGGQDWAITDLTFTEAPGATATTKLVTAKFKNLDDPRAVTFQVVEENGAWKIDNVQSAEPNAYDVRAIMAAAGLQ